MTQRDVRSARRPSPLASRPYTDADLPRVHAALAEWRGLVGLCGYCHVGDLAHRIYEGIRGRRPVGKCVRVWEHGSEIAGVAVCGRFGTAFDVFTAPAWRNTEAELAMLATAYRITRSGMEARGTGNTWVVSDVYDRDQVRAALLAQLGFERYRLWDHVTERNLAEASPAPEPPDGFSVRSVDLADAERLATVRNESFGGDWTAPTYRDEVMTRPGYQGCRETVAVARDGSAAAFATTWFDEANRVGHFEPVGTSHRFRRLGLARALLLHGLGEMRRLGMRTATVQHDASNRAATELYASLGFEKRHETYGFRRAE